MRALRRSRAPDSPPPLPRGRPRRHRAARRARRGPGRGLASAAGGRARKSLGASTCDGANCHTKPEPRDKAPYLTVHVVVGPQGGQHAVQTGTATPGSGCAGRTRAATTARPRSWPSSTRSRGRRTSPRRASAPLVPRDLGPRLRRGRPEPRRRGRAEPGAAGRPLPPRGGGELRRLPRAGREVAQGPRQGGLDPRRVDEAGRREGREPEALRPVRDLLQQGPRAVGEPMRPLPPEDRHEPARRGPPRPPLLRALRPRPAGPALA